jgi:ribosomal protein S8
MNKHIIRLLKAVNHGYKQKKKYVDVFQTTAVIAFCSRLKKEGYIDSFIYKDLKVHNYNTVLFDDLDKVNMRVFLIYTEPFYRERDKSTITLTNRFKAKPYSILKIISKPSRKLSIKT